MREKKKWELEKSPKNISGFQFILDEFLLDVT